ncbi:hypothetical protein HMPREF1425_00589 [Helicobacter pylori GAM71Ai]|nr:hypothetical protein HMPREF1425_00589 [Helicobacter pylori GAM71Ai]
MAFASIITLLDLADFTACVLIKLDTNFTFLPHKCYNHPYQSNSIHNN